MLRGLSWEEGDERTLDGAGRRLIAWLLKVVGKPEMRCNASCDAGAHGCIQVGSKKGTCNFGRVDRALTAASCADCLPPRVATGVTIKLATGTSRLIEGQGRSAKQVRTSSADSSATALGSINALHKVAPCTWYGMGWSRHNRLDDATCGIGVCRVWVAHTHAHTGGFPLSASRARGAPKTQMGASVRRKMLASAAAPTWHSHRGWLVVQAQQTTEWWWSLAAGRPQRRWWWCGRHASLDHPH